MKAHLLYRDGDFDRGRPRPPQAQALTDDLALDTLFAAMAGGDKYLADVVHGVVFASLIEPEAIRYRQRILADCLAHPDTIREMYGIAVEAIERERRVWLGAYARYPEGLLHRSAEVLGIFLEALRRLRAIADAPPAGFESDGFRTLFAMLSHELDDAYLASIEDHLRRLELRGGVVLSAALGPGNRGTNYVLRRPRRERRGWRQVLSADRGELADMVLGDRSGFVYRVADRDEAGARALGELRGRGVALAATALGESADHILSFLEMLRFELGFYVGCLNLRDRLDGKGEPICLPDAAPAAEAVLHGRGLYDVCLSLTIADRVVGNDVDADGRRLLIVTGANRGGKSTFLRATGLAQLMFQAGMFVGAEAYAASVASGVFTHYRREEDASMESGKFDEELSRMSAIVDTVAPGALVLFNESFASTNEREGSAIAREIVGALLESGIRVAYVTHMYDLAHRFWTTRRDDGARDEAVFLRAEWLPDGRRTFRVLPGEPQPTSHGEDLYRRIFGGDAAPAGGAVDARGPSPPADSMASEEHDARRPAQPPDAAPVSPCVGRRQPDRARKQPVRFGD